MSGFTQRALAQTQPIYQAITGHAFIQKMIDGTLEERVFVRYIQQDALYLAEYARALAMLAAKAPSQHALVQLLKFSEGCIIVERALHEQFLSRFKAPPALEKSAACFAYTHFLLSTTALQPFAVGMASVLPCFKIYTDVGHFIHGQAKGNNPYQPWIDTYASPEFDVLTEAACSLADHAFEHASQAEREQMLKAFTDGTRMEYGFWDDAWRLTEWV